MICNALLFNDFETLDLFGPIEIFGKVEDMELRYLSLKGGVVKNAQNCEIITQDLSHFKENELLLLIGGKGTRALVKDDEFIATLEYLALKSKFVLSVCTAAALLAKTNLLNGKKATSNQKAFEWVKEQNQNVLWQENARYIKDGKFYTSGGVSAGIDMALAFVREHFGEQKARQIAKHIEYRFLE